MGIHTGHRKRVREKIERSGFESFADHEVLEALLFHSIPYRDTNPIAHALINRAGGLANVLRLSRDEIVSISGCGDYTSNFLAVFSEMGRRSFTHTPPEDCYRTQESLRLLAFETIERIKEEVTFLLLFDNRMHLIEKRQAFCGYYASAGFRAPLVTEPALLAHASSAVLVTRHINRIARPDDYELATTRYLADALASVGVRLLEHYIVGGNICMPSINHGQTVKSFSVPLGRFAEDGDQNDK